MQCGRDIRSATSAFDKYCLPTGALCLALPRKQVAGPTVVSREGARMGKGEQSVALHMVGLTI
eukprot:4698203-Pyramimonas_sp.AAC.2